MLVLLGEYGFGNIQLPVYAERCVDYGNTSVCFGAIIVIALILEYGGIAQYSESVCKTARNEELAVVVLCQQTADVLAISGRSFADIDCHIKHRATYTSYEFGLCMGRSLEMQSTHYSS